MTVFKSYMQSAFALLIAALPQTATAQVTTSDLISAGMPAGLAEFASAVSSSEGTWTSLNQYGCAGAFQFCPATRTRYYSGSVESFLASPSAQVSAYRRYLADEWRLAERNNFTDLIGTNLCWEGVCRTIDASAILKACQFGCAYGGKLGNFHRTRDCDDRRSRDGNLVSVCTYLLRGAGYDVSDITGDFTPPPIPEGGVGTCFDRDLMAGTLGATSPFGVDRTGRASAGYHLGLDMVSSNGNGTPVFAGVPGTVVLSSANRTNSVFIETPDGRQRVGYLHGAARRVAQGDAVLPDTVVITQGDTGAPGAVHLHLEVHVSGEVMAAMGESAGRVWPLQSRGTFFGDKGSSGLSGASLEGAAPAPFYVVNPETYLHSRIQFRSSVLSASQYAAQGFSRPDGLTLEPTCAPSSDYLDGGMISSNGGHTSNGGVGDFGGALTGNPQTLANLASQGGRDAAIQYGQAAIGAAITGGNNADARRAHVSVMAGLILATFDLVPNAMVQRIGR